jgi:hypothetical protein
MRKYQVYLRGTGDPVHPAMGIVELQAEDVNLDMADSSTAFWNFTTKPEDGDDDDCITVAAFPFTEVHYIVSAE